MLSLQIDLHLLNFDCLVNLAQFNWIHLNQGILKTLSHLLVLLLLRYRSIQSEHHLLAHFLFMIPDFLVPESMSPQIIVPHSMILHLLVVLQSMVVPQSMCPQSMVVPHSMGLQFMAPLSNQPDHLTIHLLS